MKQLMCEMCGGTDLIKQEGVFVCQTCGCKYSLEEARKLLGQTTDQSSPAQNAPAKPREDQSKVIENYLNLARKAAEASNNKEAENYANKIIELDPEHAEAWLIKGEGAGWQSTTRSSRIQDAVTAWLEAINVAGEADKTKIRKEVTNKSAPLLFASVSLRCDNFASYPSAENGKAVIEALKSSDEYLNELIVKGGVSYNRAVIDKMIVDKINSSAVSGFSKAYDDFGNRGTVHSEMSKWQLENFIHSCDACLSMLDTALNYMREQKTGITLCKNLVYIGETIKNSCAYSYSAYYGGYARDYSFNDKAKELRSESIAKWKKRQQEFEQDLKSDVLDLIRAQRTQEEEDAARKKYWEENAEQKAALDAQRNQLKSQVQESEKLIQTLPVLTEIGEVKEKIAEHKDSLSKTGMFKGKERKELKGKIDSLQTKLLILNKQKLKEEEEIRLEMNNKKRRILVIDKELKKNRGQIQVGEIQRTFSEPLLNGTLNVSPQMALEFFEANRVCGFKPVLFKSTIGEKYPALADAAKRTFADLGDAVQLVFKKPKDAVENAEDFLYIDNILCFYAKDEESPASIISVKVDESSDQVATLCRELALLLYAIVDDGVLSLESIEEKICGILYDANNSVFEYGPLRIECALYRKKILASEFVEKHILIRAFN